MKGVRTHQRAAPTTNGPPEANRRYADTPTEEIKERIKMPVRWIVYGLSLLLMLLSGCAMLRTDVRTSGTTELIRWRATNFRNYTGTLEGREVYKYTLILENPHNTTITFTHLKAEIWNSSQSQGVEWEKQQQWVLSAKGTLDVPLGSYRYCVSPTCSNWGPFSPVWHITLSGTTETGHPVREQIKLHLPFVQHTASNF